MRQINAEKARPRFSRPERGAILAEALRDLVVRCVTVWIMNGYVRSLAAAMLATVFFFFLPLASGSAAERSASGVPILVYHRFGPVVADSMTVRTAVFEEQLAWLRSHDYRIMPLRELIDLLRNPAAPLPSRAVVITADDGHKSVYTDMFPLIQRYRIPVTLFIYPSAISNASYALTWEQLVEMRRSAYVDVQSHTYWHPNFNQERARRSPDDYRAFAMMQFTKSKEVIARRLGTTVDMLAWGFGIHDAQLEQWATMAGYNAAVTLERRPASRNDSLLALPRYLMTDLDRGARFAAIVESGASGQGVAP
jgi:peptidoglycan/xylan/chitin deacetylase (PgdA/CDA1 family)